MRMRAIAALVLALAMSATPALAGPDGSLDLFANAINPADGTAGAVDFGSCSAPVSVLFNGFLGRVSFSLYARLSGATVDGVAAAECYLTNLEAANLPAGWTVTTTFAPNMTVVGNLTSPHMQGTDTNRRVSAAWDVLDAYNDPDCQKAPLTFVARVDLTSPFGAGNTFTAQNHYVSVVPANPPFNPTVPFASLLQCNTPIFTQIAVTGGQFIINPSGAMISAQCTVAVEQETWSGVKALYR